MLIEFECVSCGKPLAVPESASGRRARCPLCQTTNSVPDFSADDEEDDEHEDDDHDEGIHKPPKKEYHDLVDMTAMVDIVFFLLIFFLMTSLYTLKPAIPMPKTEQAGAGSSTSSADGDSDVVTVRIDEKDVVHVDDVMVATDRDLRDKLSELVRNGAGAKTLKINGSPDATHGTLVMVMDAGAAAGMAKVQLSIKSNEDL